MPRWEALCLNFLTLTSQLDNSKTSIAPNTLAWHILLQQLLGYLPQYIGPQPNLTKL